SLREVQVGEMEGISITNIRAEGTKYTSFIAGHKDSPIRNVYLNNVYIRKERAFYKEVPANPVPECADAYPGPVMFGSAEAGDQLPAFGLYLRNVENAILRDLRVDCVEPDAREILVQESCGEV